MRLTAVFAVTTPASTSPTLPQPRVRSLDLKASGSTVPYVGAKLALRCGCSVA